MASIIESSRNKVENSVAILYDMEKNNHLMRRGLIQLDKTIASLAIARNISAPQKQKVSFLQILLGLEVFFAGIGACIGGVIGLFVGFLEYGGFFMRILGAFAGTIYYGLIVGGCAAALGFVVAIFISIRDSKRSKSDYSKACVDYEERIKYERLRLQREGQQKQNLIEERARLHEKYCDSFYELESYYSTVGIAEEYRNFIAIGYMYKFVELGISDKLGGTDGLYYLVREELQWEELMRRLTEISDKLDMMIDNTSRLYEDLQRLNRRCDELVSYVVKTSSALSNIERNTELTAYNTERIAQEEIFRNYLLAYYAS